MSVRPWMPWHIPDFVSDTAHLTAAQTGAYLMLLGYYWLNGKLPIRDSELARIARMTPKEWSGNKPVISAFFSSDWKNNRLEKERAKARDVSEKRAANARVLHQQNSSKPSAKNQQAASKTDANLAAAGSANAHVLQDDLQTHKHKQEKEAPAANAPLARSALDNFFSDDAPADEPPQAKLFRVGRVILISLGVAEKRTGPLLGGWLKQSHNDHAGLLAALEYARQHVPQDPISYVTALLSKGKGNGKPKTLADRARELADEARQRERAAGIRRPDDRE